MKIPMYYDFIQTGDKKKFNGIPFEISNEFLHDHEFEFLFFEDPINDVLFVKNDYKEKFYYPIFWRTGHVRVLEYFSNLTIPKFILNKINENKAKLLIISSEGEDFIDDIEERIIKKYDLSWENIVILSGNKCKIDNINTIYVNYWKQHYTKIHNESPKFLYDKAYNLIFNNDNLRQCKYICLQHKPRVHRLALYAELYPYKEDGILTLGEGVRFMSAYEMYNQLEKLYKKPFEEFKKMNLIETLPAEYDMDISFQGSQNDLIFVFDTDIEKFYKSYLHIVSETFFENLDNIMFFSEKTYKPVVHFQPFVMFNQTNSLNEFRSMGYETFSNIIDESYDGIQDNEKRLLSAVNSITDFIKQDKKTLHNIMKDIFPVLAHNYYNLWAKVKNNNDDIKSQLILNLYN